MKKHLLPLLALLSFFLFSLRLDAVTFNVTVPSETYQCWIAGNFCGWNNNKHQMTKVDANHYTLTINESDFSDQTVNLSNIRYKYLKGGGDWAYVEKSADGSEIPDRSYHERDTVLSWAQCFCGYEPIKGFVTINAQVPSTINELYLVGNFCSWSLPTDSTKMKLVETNASGKHFSLKIWTNDAQKLQYKFCAGPAWDYEQTESANFMMSDPILSEDFVLISSFKAIYDSTKLGDVNMTINVPLGTDSVWIQGSLYNWNWNNPSAQLCTKVTDGKFKYTVKQVMQMEYRLYNKPAWDYPEIDSLGYERANRKLSYPADAQTTITVKGWKNGYTPYIDKQAPSQPTELIFTLATLNSITLSWNASTDNVSVISYDVYKDGVFYINTTSTWTSVLNLKQNTSYSFTVVARDAAGNKSIESAKLIVKTANIDTQPPTQPSVLSSIKVAANSVTLQWNPSTDDTGVVSYDVYKNGVFYKMTTSELIEVTGLLPNTTYSFTVIARDAFGHNSLESDKFVVSTLNTTGGKFITFNVTVPDGTYQCWIVGNFCGWNNNKYQMSKVDAHHYILTINEAEFTDKTVNVSNIQYKYLQCGGDWGCVEKAASGVEILDRSYHEQDTVLKWPVFFPPPLVFPGYVTIKAQVSSSVNELYLVGNFCSWALPTDSTKMKLVETNASGKLFSLRIWTDDLRSLQYRFCAGPTWDYQQSKKENFYFPSWGDTTTVETISSFDYIYDKAKLGTIKIKATVPTGTIECWLQGSFLGWKIENSQLGIKNQDGTFSFTAKDVYVMNYRLYNGLTWNDAEVDETGKDQPNRIVEFPKDSVTSISVYAWRNANGIQPVHQNRYRIFTQVSDVVVEGVESDERVEVYNLFGVMLKSAISQGEQLRFSLRKGAIYLIKVGAKTVKVAM
ncbi:MAG: fibronectin type III domain-containing protein [Bacteroidales bacterium]|nr:fibronectin type III domain-containing protein [Bacteroidales bacterium]